MPFCGKCGEQGEEGNAFCTRCGARLESEVEVHKADQRRPEALDQPTDGRTTSSTPFTNLESASTDPTAVPSSNKVTRSNTVMLAIMLLVVALTTVLPWASRVVVWPNHAIYLGVAHFAWALLIFGWCLVTGLILPFGKKLYLRFYLFAFIGFGLGIVGSAFALLQIHSNLWSVEPGVWLTLVTSIAFGLFSIVMYVSLRRMRQVPLSGSMANGLSVHVSEETQSSARFLRTIKQIDDATKPSKKNTRRIVGLVGVCLVLVGVLVAVLVVIGTSSPVPNPKVRADFARYCRVLKLGSVVSSGVADLSYASYTCGDAPLSTWVFLNFVTPGNTVRAAENKNQSDSGPWCYVSGANWFVLFGDSSLARTSIEANALRKIMGGTSLRGPLQSCSNEPG